MEDDIEPSIEHPSVVIEQNIDELIRNRKNMNPALRLSLEFYGNIPKFKKDLVRRTNQNENVETHKKGNKSIDVLLNNEKREIKKYLISPTGNKKITFLNPLSKNEEKKEILQENISKAKENCNNKEINSKNNNLLEKIEKNLKKSDKIQNKIETNKSKTNSFDKKQKKNQENREITEKVQEKILQNKSKPEKEEKSLERTKHRDENIENIYFNTEKKQNIAKDFKRKVEKRNEIPCKMRTNSETFDSMKLTNYLSLKQIFLNKGNMKHIKNTETMTFDEFKKLKKINEPQKNELSPSKTNRVHSESNILSNAENEKPFEKFFTETKNTIDSKSSPKFKVIQFKKKNENANGLTTTTESLSPKNYTSIA